MTRDAWLTHAKAVGYFNLNTFERLNHAQDCGICQERLTTRRANRRRRERDSVLRSLGLVKTRYGWE